MIKILSDYREMDHTLRQLTLMPTPEMTAELSMIFTMAFDATQAEVHRVTASLAMSGKMTTDEAQEDGTWSGDIEYGGASAGVHNPVVYAYYEKRRGGSHDFMRGGTVILDTLGETIAKGLADA